MHIASLPPYTTELADSIKQSKFFGSGAITAPGINNGLGALPPGPPTPIQRPLGPPGPHNPPIGPPPGSYPPGLPAGKVNK